MTICDRFMKYLIAGSYSWSSHIITLFPFCFYVSRGRTTSIRAAAKSSDIIVSVLVAQLAVLLLLAKHN
jgi:hypothetical protein